jgi:WD domain, G-beta repeat
VVSPEAIKSEHCRWEVDKTVELSKRLLPVIFKPVPDTEIPEKLRQLQFVRFDTGPGVARPLSQLAEALRQDFDWIREHTRIGEIAARWQVRDRPESLLLRGDDLDAARDWAAKRQPAAPEITDLQRAFLNVSAEAETARLGNERQQIENMRRVQRRVTWLLLGVALLVVGLLANVIMQDRDVIRREQVVFTSLAAQAMKDEQFDRAMRFALQAYPAGGAMPWAPLSTELQGLLAGGALSTYLHRVLKGHTGPVLTATFSPDGKRVVTASGDNTARLWDVTWVTLVRGEILRERVCAEKLVGSAQDFSSFELEDPIMRGVTQTNPCLRRGPLSLDYWISLPGEWLGFAAGIIGTGAP